MLAKQKLGNKVDSTYHIKMIHDRNGEFLHHFLIWVANPALYHVLLGCDVDGKKRMKRVERVKTSALAVYKPGDSWADIDEEDDFEYVTLGPHFELPGFDYSAKQLADMKAEEEEFMKSKTAPTSPSAADVKTASASKTTPTSPEGKASPAPTVKRGQVLLYPYEIEKVSDDEVANKLRIGHVPKWVDEKDIFNLFVPFDTTGIITNKKRRFPDVRKLSSYNGKDVAFTITFDAHTNDALFARQMCNFYRLTKTWLGKEETTVLKVVQQRESGARQADRNDS